jgi:hypothetical protein
VNLSESGPATLRLEFVGGPFSFDWMDIATASGNENPPASQRPFFAQAAPLPGRIQAEYFDLGGPEIAYRDHEPENLTHTFRNEGVDIEPSQDHDGTPSLSYFDDAEWLEYTVIPEPGIYEITLRSAAGVESPGSLRITLGSNELALVQTPDTGGSLTWESTAVSGITIGDAGPQILRLEAVGSGINLIWIDFRRVGPLPGAPADPAPSGDELLAAAFSPEDIDPIFPQLSQIPTRASSTSKLTLLTKLGGWQTAEGYATREFRYLPQASPDLVNWNLPVTLVTNPSGLPIPPQGFKYQSYRLATPESKRAFFRVRIDAQ